MARPRFLRSRRVADVFFFLCVAATERQIRVRAKLIRNEFMACWWQHVWIYLRAQPRTIYAIRHTKGEMLPARTGSSGGGGIYSALDAHVDPDLWTALIT